MPKQPALKSALILLGAGAAAADKLPPCRNRAIEGASHSTVVP